MAKTTDNLKAAVLIVNTAFLSDKGNVQSYSCRERGEVNSKSIKVAPAMVKGRSLMAGDVLYVSDATVEGDTNSNYRTMRTGHVEFDLPTTSAPEAPAAPAAAVEDIPFTE